MDLSAGAAIRDDALSAAGARCCQGAAAAAAAAAASTTTALAFLRLVTFRTGMIILELATTTAVSIFYLCSLQPQQAA